MPIYKFKAKTIQGKVVHGEVNATNETEARVQLRAQYLMHSMVKDQ